MTLEHKFCIGLDGTKLVVHKANCSNPDAEALVLLHANGFSAATYVELIGILSAQFTVYAIDLRGHGASADGPAWSTSVPKQAAVLHLEGGAHAEPRITQEQVHARMEGFPIPVTDIIEILHQLDLEQPLCFGHSLGGSVALVAELFRPGLWKAVCAFEPPVTATDQQDQGNERAAARRAQAARKRRRTFDSLAAAKERLRGKLPFSLLTPSSFDGLIESCLVPNDSGGALLRCTIEAEIFETARYPASIIREYIHTLSCPVMFCRGHIDPTSPDFDMVAALESLVSRCPTARLFTFPDLTHMGPLSHPSVVARVIFDSFLAGPQMGSNPTAVHAHPQPLSRL